MKLRHGLLIGCVSALLGLGAFAGASSNMNTKKANAYGGNDTWYLSGTFNNWIGPTDNNYTSYLLTAAGKSGNDFQYHIVFAFDSGAEFKFVNRYVNGGNVGANWKGLNWMDPSNPSEGGINENGGDNNVTVSRNLKADMYFKINESGSATGLYWSEVFSTVTVNVNNSSYGSASAASTSISYKGTTTLTATPKTGYKFSCWKQGSTTVSTNKSYTTPAITDDITYTAYFEPLTALDTPTNFTNTNGVFSWNSVSNAASYDVEVNDGTSTQVYSVNGTSYDARTHLAATYRVRVRAVGDGVEYGVSNYTSQLQYVVAPSYYLVGTFNDWSTTGDSTELVPVINGSVYTFSNVTVGNSGRVKLIKHTSGGGTTWIDVETLNVNPVTDLKYHVWANDGKDVVLDVSGSYTITITNISDTGSGDNGHANYTVERNNYTPDYKIGIGGSYRQASLNPNNNREFYVSGVNLTAGDIISYKDGDTVVNNSTAKAVRDNNMTSSKAVLFDVTNATIYVDVTTREIWVTGIYGVYSPGYHILLKSGSSTRMVAMTNNPSPADPSFIEYYSEAIQFAQNDIVRFVDTSENNSGLTKVFDITRINAGGLGNKFTSTASGLKAIESVEAAVYMKLKTDNDEVYFGTVSEELAAAIKFAQDFNTAIEAACDYDGNTDVVNDLNPAWQLQVTAFSGLIVKAQNRLKSATATDTVEDIRLFILKYTMVAEKYGSRLGEGYNFLNKTLNSPSGMVLTAIADNTSAGASSVTVIASVFMASIVGSGFILLKKKKLK